MQNVIERAIITTSDNILRVELPTQKPSLPIACETTEQSLEAVEREHIRRVLESKNWRIQGPDGAAKVLGLHPSTLRFRIKKLGIRRP